MQIPQKLVYEKFYVHEKIVRTPNWRRSFIKNLLSKKRKKTCKPSNRNLNRNSIRMSEAVTRSCFVKKMFLKVSQNSQKNTCARVFFLIKLQTSGNFIKKAALAQMFSYEIWENLWALFYITHPVVTFWIFIWIIFCLVLIFFLRFPSLTLSMY